MSSDSSKIIARGDSKIWISSDLHFGHKNIVQGNHSWGYRPFKDVQDMDDSIINNINSVVGVNDIFLILGDFCFGNAKDVVSYRRRILCQDVRLMMGNHDYPRVFEEVPEGTFTYLDYGYCGAPVYKFIEKDGHEVLGRACLHHYPICSWEQLSKGLPLLHGHVHLDANNRLSSTRALDVGIEGSEYFPMLVKDALAIANAQPVGPMDFTGRRDHHA